MDAKRRRHLICSTFDLREEGLSPPLYSPEMRGAVCYIDTVGFLLPHFITGPAKDWLESLCGKNKLTGKGKLRQVPLKEPYGKLYVRLQLHQPSAEALAFVAAVFDGQEYLLNQVHLALDLITDSAKDADELHVRWATHLHRTHLRGTTEAYQVKTTDYVGPLWGRRQDTTYSDRPSKHNGLPCLHVEHRLNGLSLVHGAGIKSVEDLLAFSQWQYWRSELGFREIDPEALGRVICGVDGRRRPRPSQYEGVSREKLCGVWNLRWARWEKSTSPDGDWSRVSLPQVLKHLKETYPQCRGDAPLKYLTRLEVDSWVHLPPSKRRPTLPKKRPVTLPKRRPVTASRL